MKNVIWIMISFVLIGFFYACEKEEKKVTTDLIGTWISLDKTDTLIFVTSNRLERPRDYFFDLYDYSNTSDNLTIQYTGPDKIYAKSMSSTYKLSDNILTIDFTSNYYPNILKGETKYQKE